MGQNASTQRLTNSYSYSCHFHLKSAAPSADSWETLEAERGKQLGSSHRGADVCDKWVLRVSGPLHMPVTLTHSVMEVCHQSRLTRPLMNWCWPPNWSRDSLRCDGRMMDVGNVSGRDRWGRRRLPVRGILALSDGTKVRNLARITTQKSVETGFWDSWPCSHWQTDLLPIPSQLVPLIFTVTEKNQKDYSAEFVRIKP